LDFLWEGEEPLVAARLFTAGWDAFAPGSAVAYHHYGRFKALRFWHVQYSSEQSNEDWTEWGMRVSEQRVQWMLEVWAPNSTRPLIVERPSSDSSSGPSTPLLEGSKLQPPPRALIIATDAKSGEYIFPTPAPPGTIDPRVFFEGKRYGMGCERPLDWWYGLAAVDRRSRTVNASQACEGLMQSDTKMRL
jgi:hypothetical protein